MIRNIEEGFMSKRGRPSKETKLLNKNNNTHTVNISLSIPLTILNKIEQNIRGDSRSGKIMNCIEAGYPIIMTGNTK